ncbi:hypothetical protein Bhyg_03279 [Pseudolycoriella hygida]|uniref:WH2 domain-containing protein n=1 Tax=Pseudolycoriella hygida TaxID=35572 RepID=A0A9Q0S7D9_9DIPT|nr:hypothetical protein Bhyg_03279 [Pseudolycoriella hygida]
MDLLLPPPPPPPPSNAMFLPSSPQTSLMHVNQNLNDRSQLLIDIEKGTSLKKVSNSQKGSNSRPTVHTKLISSSNECNGIDNNNYNEESINPIKNQLQAELCSTLHRRQNNGNKKPNFIISKNTTINAINNQLRELQNNVQAQPNTNGKTIENTANKAQTAPNAKENEEKPKLLLSHGRPNFKISTNSMNSKKVMENKDSSPSDELFGTLKKRLKSVESLDDIEITEKNSRSLIAHESQEMVEQPLKIAQQTQKNASDKSHSARIEINNVLKSPIAPPVFYKASIKNYNATTKVNNFSNVSTTESNDEIKQTIKRLKSVESLEQIQKSVDDKTEMNDIQRRIQNLKTVDVNKTNILSNSRSTEVTTEERSSVQSISVRSVTEQTDCFQSSPILPRRAQLFKQQQNLANSKITSPTIHHINRGNLNYKPKPVTSFSRDLQLTPNRYPDKIPVTKNIEPEPVFFSDIKFSINSNGEVVRS